jgi:hypothetical protein
LVIIDLIGIWSVNALLISNNLSLSVLTPCRNFGVLPKASPKEYPVRFGKFWLTQSILFEESVRIMVTWFEAIFDDDCTSNIKKNRKLFF